MLSMLDTASQRVVKILDLFLIKNDWLKLKDISEELDIPMRTLNSDIKYIKEEFYPLVKIETSPYSGIRVTQLTEDNLNKLKQQLIQNSDSLRLLYELIFIPNKNAKYYYEKLKIKKSSFYKHINELNLFINKFNLRIEIKKFLYCIASDSEITARQFITIFIAEYSGHSLSNVVTQEMKKNLTLRLERLLKINNEELYQVELPYFITFYFVSCIRENQQFIAEKPSEFVGELLVDFSHFEDSFIMETLSINDLQMANIESIILLNRYKYNSHCSDKVLNHISEFIDSFIQESIYTKDINKKEMVMNYFFTIYYHRKYVNIPFHLSTNSLRYLSKSIVKDNPKKYNIIYTHLERLSDSLETNLTEDIDYFISILLITYPDLFEINYSEKILILSSISLNHAEFLRDFISSQLMIDKYLLTCSNLEDVERKYLLSNFDYIVTNTFYLDFPVAKIIVINDYPNSKDLANISNKINGNSNQLTLNSTN